MGRTRPAAPHPVVQKRSSFTRNKLAKLFAGWDIVKNQVAEDYADWTQRKTRLIRFVAKKR